MSCRGFALYFFVDRSRRNGCWGQSINRLLSKVFYS